MLYEIGDPANYILPDVVVDFSSVTVSQTAVDEVRIQGASGRAPTPSYKVCVTRPEGFMISGFFLFPGIYVLLFFFFFIFSYSFPTGHECRQKAERVGKSILENANAGLAKLGLPPVTEYNISIIGGTGVAEGYEECVLRLAFAHNDYKALQIAGEYCSVYSYIFIKAFGQVWKLLLRLYPWPKASAGWALRGVPCHPAE
jgi:hypothetical protein